MRLLPDDPEIGWTPYAWLVYLAPFVTFPGFAHASAGEWGLTIAGLLAFLVLYFVGYWVGGARLLAVVAGIELIGLGFGARNWGAASFFIYAAAFLGRKVPPPRGTRLLLLHLALVVAAAWLVPLAPFVWVPALVFSAIIGGINMHYAQLSRSNARLRLAQEEVEHLAKVAERERIARDLHDLLGHTLSVIVLKSELATKLAERDPRRAIEEMREVERISRDALAEVRAAVSGYRSRGLLEELASARRTLEGAGVAVTCDAQPVPLDPAQEGVLALALREAVTNVVRHAGARACRVRLACEDGRALLEVHDDGRGGAAPEGVGLAGMRERVQALGGTLDRDGASGTRLVVALPLRGAA